MLAFYLSRIHFLSTIFFFFLSSSILLSIPRFLSQRDQNNIRWLIIKLFVHTNRSITVGCAVATKRLTTMKSIEKEMKVWKLYYFFFSLKGVKNLLMMIISFDSSSSWRRLDLNRKKNYFEGKRKHISIRNQFEYMKSCQEFFSFTLRKEAKCMNRNFSIIFHRWKHFEYVQKLNCAIQVF